ncbi:MAG: hypothetical protein HKN08_10190 [Gammaproteobacteria bacterium]|nr:hypothetical protein [Gammaproteobacteria bacterium]
MDQLQVFHHLSSQVKILYNQSVITFFFPVLFAPAVCMLLWEISDHRLLLSWGSVVVTYSLARYLIIWKQKQEGITPENVNKWLDIFIASVFISGLLWGVACIILVPYEPGKIIEFTIYNSLTMLIVCGLVSGAVVTYSVNKWVIIFYAFPALIPPAIYLVILGDKYNSALGGFVFLFFIFITASSIRLNKQFTYYIDLEYEMIMLKERLRKYLEQSGKHKATT